MSPELQLPGFRFHPTEEELIDFYLKKTVFGKKLSYDVIGFLNIYHHDPWDLPGLSKIGEREWYFFVPRDRKHGNGGRPNRITEHGFWKATGSDRKIFSLSDPKRLMGLRKTLVFYMGRAPRGTKTDWVMNEYRLPDNCTIPKDIVLCKIYRKATPMKVLEQRAMEEEMMMISASPPLSCSMENQDFEAPIATTTTMAAAQKMVPKTELEEEKKEEGIYIETSSSLKLPSGIDKLSDLQVPKLISMDWTQDNFWTQFNSPWLQNYNSYANILNF